jgi:UDP-N-acetylmuramate dehydrogenase
LIDRAGLRGATVGQAQVSERHCNFIVNRGGATAGEVLALIGRVRDEVEGQTGIRLETEVRIIGQPKAN